MAATLGRVSCRRPPSSREIPARHMPPHVISQASTQRTHPNKHRCPRLHTPAPRSRHRYTTCRSHAAAIQSLSEAKLHQIDRTSRRHTRSDGTNPETFQTEREQTTMLRAAHSQLRNLSGKRLFCQRSSRLRKGIRLTNQIYLQAHDFTTNPPSTRSVP